MQDLAGPAATRAAHAHGVSAASVHTALAPAGRICPQTVPFFPLSGVVIAEGPGSAFAGCSLGIGMNGAKISFSLSQN